jgi:hypothetical protein
LNSGKLYRHRAYGCQLAAEFLILAFGPRDPDPFAR